jgi:hypothetical protein
MHGFVKQAFGKLITRLTGWQKISPSASSLLPLPTAASARSISLRSGAESADDGARQAAGE